MPLPSSEAPWLRVKRNLFRLLLRLPRRLLSYNFKPVNNPAYVVRKHRIVAAACAVAILLFLVKLFPFIYCRGYRFICSAGHPVLPFPLLLYPTLSFPILPLNSSVAHSLLQQTYSIRIPDPFTSPWSGLRDFDSPFDPERKYLYIPRGGDWCVGFNHYVASLKCRVEEAIRMNRTLVLDDEFCTNRVHTRDDVSRVLPLYAYFNMEGIRRRVPFVPLSAFRSGLQSYLGSSPLSPSPSPPLSVMVLPPHFRILSVAVTRRRPEPALVVRNTTSVYGFRVCGQCPWVSASEKQTFWPHPALTRIARRIAESINGSDFVAVHVRRGDKMKDKKHWPHTEEDTRPESLLRRLPHLVPVGTPLYLATNEMTPGFFDPLKQAYQVHTIDDFSYLWAPGSQWHATYSQILGPDPTFDDTMKGIVDYGVCNFAKSQIETFNDLTGDPEDGRSDLFGFLQ